LANYTYKNNTRSQTGSMANSTMAHSTMANTSHVVIGGGGAGGPQQYSGLSNQQLTALTSNNFGHLNTVSISGMDYIVGSHHPDVKKYEIYESPEDLLTLSVAWKRCRDGNKEYPGFRNLLDTSLFKEITPEDQHTADEIRDYYSKKIMMWKLKGTKLTTYREDLNSFVHSDGKKFRESSFGLAYYLPDFYEHDMNLDDVRLQVDPRIGPYKENTTKKLKPLKRIVKKNKKGTSIQYWFKDDDTNASALLTLEPKNPLAHIWDYLFETKELLSIAGLYYTNDSKYEFEYFSIKNWKLIQG
jgi:hypothetical protein